MDLKDYNDDALESMLNLLNEMHKDFMSWREMHKLIPGMTYSNLSKLMYQIRCEQAQRKGEPNPPEPDHMSLPWLAYA